MVAEQGWLHAPIDTVVSIIKTIIILGQFLEKVLPLLEGLRDA